MGKKFQTNNLSKNQDLTSRSKKHPHKNHHKHQPEIKNHSLVEQKRLDAKHLKQFFGATKKILSNSSKNTDLTIEQIASLYQVVEENLFTYQAKQKMQLEFDKISNLSDFDVNKFQQRLVIKMRSQQHLPKLKRQELIAKHLDTCIDSIQKALEIIFPNIWVDKEYVKETMEEHLKHNYQKVLNGGHWWIEVSELVVACYIVIYSRLLDGSREQRRKVLNKIKNLHLRQRIAEVVDRSLHDIVTGGHLVARILHLEVDPIRAANTNYNTSYNAN